MTHTFLLLPSARWQLAPLKFIIPLHQKSEYTSKSTLYTTCKWLHSKTIASVPTASVWTRSSLSTSNGAPGNGGPSDDSPHPRFQKRYHSHHPSSSESPFSHSGSVSAGAEASSTAKTTDNDVDGIGQSLRQYMINDQPPSLPPLPQIHFNF